MSLVTFYLRQYEGLGHRVKIPTVNKGINECCGDVCITAYVGWKMSSELIIPNQYTAETIATIRIIVNCSAFDSLYIYIYIYIYVCVCVCVCV